MIAQGYTRNGERQRGILEKVADPLMEFKTWDRVIDETERMHLGWLEVSRLRSLEPEPEPAAVATATAAADEPTPTPASAEDQPA